MLKSLRSRFWTAFSRIADAIQVLGVPGVAAMTGSFALPAWAAYVTDWLNAWGPIAWVTCGFAGLLLFCLSMLVWGRYRESASLAAMHEAMSLPPRHANPLRADFTDEKLSLADFFNPLHLVYSGKTFRRCHIHGPGVLMLRDRTNMDDSKFQRCDVVEVADGVITSCVAFERTTFDACYFFHVTFIITPDISLRLEQDAHRYGRPPPHILRSRGENAPAVTHPAAAQTGNL